MMTDGWGNAGRNGLRGTDGSCEDSWPMVGMRMERREEKRGMWISDPFVRFIHHISVFCAALFVFALSIT